MPIAPLPPKLPAVLPALTPPALEPSLGLEHGELIELDWSHQTARRLNLDTLRLTNPDFTGAVLREGSWADVHVSGGQFAGLNLAGSSCHRLRLEHLRADGLVLSETLAKDLTIIDTKLDLANFRFLKWSRVQFIRCQLREADFVGATLTDIGFEDCDLVSCDFSGAKLTRVDLRSSRLVTPKGLAGLRGATLDADQLITLIPELAAELGIIIPFSQ